MVKNILKIKKKKNTKNNLHINLKIKKKTEQTNNRINLKNIYQDTS